MGSVVEIEGLTKRYGRTTAVDDVTFSVAEREVFGYLGPNGAGKTTTIRCILGLIRPSLGRIRVLGHDVRRELAVVLTDLGYLPGEFGLWPQMTGAECLDYLGALHPHSPALRSDLCDRFELARADLDRQVRFYSRGMKQKVGIVQAFQHDPPLVILDEPTEGLDPVLKERFVDLLREHRARGGSTLLSSHILSEVEETAQRVAVLRRGRLLKMGPTEDLAGDRVRRCTLVLAEATSLTPLLSLPGVNATPSDGLVQRFEFRGEMDQLLRALAGLPVQDLLIEPERLAEAFFDVYGEE